MHDAIAELGGPDLARLGPGDDETNRPAGAVPPAAQLGVQVEQVSLQPVFKRQRAGGVALVRAAVCPRLNQVMKAAWA
ncbi:MAG: hypothetical protein Q8K14_05335 [Hydrogenophaga sp.]|uniref:hypothetical protein n=1 Tax=Hydrogenophaga sp. TaxID=1904254 RepID=UPI002732D6CE|nr:hypothetical protein [Hydrogenophaga sp.]MDP2249839.1 hypothetical protein [Hydrogenophaga sp.]MDP3625050.1 hypothetical protein [Hydrogenophaga sp.]